MEMKAVNDFADCLDKSHAAHDLPLWRELYQNAFPDFVDMHCCRDDGQHQRQGIDRVVVLANGKSLWIDEKVRSRNKVTGRVYEDIALEFVSSDSNNAPGWVCKPLLCDYIAYAIAPLGVGYLLPTLQLQAAWHKYGEHWKRRDDCRTIKARNNGYNTISLCVPPKVLFPAIGKMLRPQFTPCEF